MIPTNDLAITPAQDEPLTTPEEIALTEDPQSMLGEDMKNLQAKLLEEQPEQHRYWRCRKQRISS